MRKTVDEGESESDYISDLNVDESHLSAEELKEKRLHDYPWLEPDDFRLMLSKAEIIRKLVDLSDTKFNEEQKGRLLESLERNSACFFSFW